MITPPSVDHVAHFAAPDKATSGRVARDDAQEARRLASAGRQNRSKRRTARAASQARPERAHKLMNNESGRRARLPHHPAALVGLIPPLVLLIAIALTLPPTASITFGWLPSDWQVWSMAIVRGLVSAALIPAVIGLLDLLGRVFKCW